MRKPVFAAPLVRVIAACSLVFTDGGGLLKVVDAVVSLRVSSEEETEGLDIALHEECGYNLQAG